MIERETAYDDTNRADEPGSIENQLHFFVMIEQLTEILPVLLVHQMILSKLVDVVVVRTVDISSFVENRIFESFQSSIVALPTA